MLFAIKSPQHREKFGHFFISAQDQNVDSESEHISFESLLVLQSAIFFTSYFVGRPNVKRFQTLWRTKTKFCVCVCVGRTIA